MADIEQFDPGHLDGCARIFSSIFNEEPWNEPWTVQTARGRLAEALATPGAYGLVQLGPAVEAFVVGYGEQGYDGRVFYIKEMCVATNLQRQGIGTILMQELQNALSTEGYGHVYLLTHREGAAAAFYGQQGYRTSKRTVVMSRALQVVV